MNANANHGHRVSDATAWPVPEPAGMGRSVFAGVAVGFTLSLIGVTAGLLVAGQELSTAIGLGLFTAVWGGLGFGAMMGGVMYLERAAKAPEPERSAPSIAAARRSTNRPVAPSGSEDLPAAS